MCKLFLTLFLCCGTLLAAAQEGIIKFANGQLHYRSYGSGKPLLIINGGPGMNSNGFVALAKRLAKNNRTIIYDQRGTGKSTLPVINDQTITMDLMVADLERLRTELKIEKWVVLGHSFGGMLASYYATFHPERIDKLILSSSGGIDLELQSYASQVINNKLTATERSIVQHCNSLISNGDTTYKTRLLRGMNLAPAYVYDRKNIPIIAQRLTEGNSALNQMVWNDMQRIHFDCAEKLKTFRQPVLIIQGKQDIVAEKTALKAKRAFKNSRVVLLEHCVHYGWLDNPEAYFKTIDEFLDGR